MKTLKSLLIICGLLPYILITGCEDLWKEDWEAYKIFTVKMKNESNFKANLWIDISYSVNSEVGTFYAESPSMENEIASLGSRTKRFDLPKTTVKDGEDVSIEYFGNYYVTINSTTKASLKDISVNSSEITLVWDGAELKIE